MRTKPFRVFWGSAIAATLFLGALWNTTAQASSHPALDAMVLVVASLGLACSLLVAGRIVVVLGRVQRRERAARR